ncbi:MAG: type II toxin-antitoxin system Phd/YefM family antitoxin [Clostridia bacterium]|nr:type II toxin-antitoxin system Phd/YefM family antitoxin [Clostridia bacterium]
MPSIRPISDLRNHFAEITKEAQTSGEPVFLTKNGVGALVVMSMEAYEANRYESEIYDKLREAEMQSRASNERFSHDEVMAAARIRIEKVKNKESERA